MHPIDFHRSTTTPHKNRLVARFRRRAKEQASAEPRQLGGSEASPSSRKLIVESPIVDAYYASEQSEEPL